MMMREKEVDVANLQGRQIVKNLQGVICYVNDGKEPARLTGNTRLQQSNAFYGGIIRRPP